MGLLTLYDAGSITETATNGGTAANASDQDDATVVTTTTNISTIDQYVVIHYDLGSAQNIGVVYLNGASLSAGTNSEWNIEVSTDDVSWTIAGENIELTTTAKDFSRRVGGSYRYVRFVRNGNADLGTAKATIQGMDIGVEGAVSNTRCIDFEFNVDQTYKMVVSDKNIAIYQGTTYLVDVYIEDLTSARLPAISWESDADTLIIFHEDVETIRLTRSGANDVWVLSTVTWENIPFFAFDGVSTSTPSGSVTMSSSDTGLIDITGSGTNFTASYVGQYINAVPASKTGRVRIIGVDSTTAMTGYAEIGFSDTGLSSGEWELEDGYEAIWSSTRGYPRRGVFYQERLWVDGGKSRPSVAYGSRVSDFFNYEFGEAVDDDAIGPLTGGFDPIEAFFAGRNLVIMTSKAEYIIPQTFGDPITPTNASMARQSSLGSEANFRPQEIEGAVMYIQREGASVQEFIYDDTIQSFSNNFVSLLSSHLVSNPVDFAIRKATSTEDGSYLLMVKGDGNLTMANLLRSQGITSFVEAETNGSFKSCGVDVSDMYFVIERTINGTTSNYLERFNSNLYLDACTTVSTGLPTDTFTGLDHLEGETVKVIADDANLDDETVSSGSVTVDRDVETSVQIGMDYTVTAKDLPAATVIGSEASMVGRKMNVSEISLRLRNTRGIVVNGKTLSFRKFGTSGGNSPLDVPAPLFTGVKRLLGWRGWEQDAQVTITQNVPAPMTVLSIKKRVNT